MFFDKQKMKDGENFKVGFKYFRKVVNDRDAIKVKMKGLCKSCKRKALKLTKKGKAFQSGDDGFCPGCLVIIKELGEVYGEV